MSKDYTKLSEKQWKKIEPPMLPPRNVKIQAEVLKESHAILDKAGLRHWLVDGTLIVIVRDKKLQPYNQDTDFACYAEDIQPIMKRLRKMFLEAGYTVRAYKNDTRLDTYKNGEMISVQGYVKKKGKFRWLKNKKIPERYFENEETIEFEGVTYRTPSINKYLKWKYTNWKVPYTGNTKNKCYLNKKKLVGHV